MVDAPFPSEARDDWSIRRSSNRFSCGVWPLTVSVGPTGSALLRQRFLAKFLSHNAVAAVASGLQQDWLLSRR